MSNQFSEQFLRLLLSQKQEMNRNGTWYSFANILYSPKYIEKKANDFNINLQDLTDEEKRKEE